MVLLAAVALVSAMVAGGLALLDRAPAQPAAASAPAYLADSTQVRIVGAPFVPNTNPRER